MFFSKQLLLASLLLVTSANGVVVGEYSTSGARASMEDATVNAIINLNNKQYQLNAIFDGHGGSFCAKKSATLLPGIVKELIEDNQFDVDNVLHGSFIKLEQYIKAKIEEVEKAFPDCNYGNCGTTALVTLFNQADRVLYVAWAGDSRAVIGQVEANGALLETRDHKPNDPEEKKRIEAAGGKIYRYFGIWRVGNLAVSRAIGDFNDKKSSPITAEPEFGTIEIISQNVFIILACDGLWDVMSSDKAVQFVNDRMAELNVTPATINREAANAIAQQLVNEVLGNYGDQIYIMDNGKSITKNGAKFDEKKDIPTYLQYNKAAKSYFSNDNVSVQIIFV